MLTKCLAVGLGGAVGSVLRYLVSRIDLQRSGNYPINTFLVNIIGAMLIGAVISYAGENGMNEEKLLFLKMGLCGGLTTFSTFSVEALGFIESGSLWAAATYAVVTVVICVFGVYIGMKIGSIL